MIIEDILNGCRRQIVSSGDHGESCFRISQIQKYILDSGLRDSLPAVNKRIPFIAGSVADRAPVASGSVEKNTVLAGQNGMLNRLLDIRADYGVFMETDRTWRIVWSEGYRDHSGPVDCLRGDGINVLMTESKQLNGCILR